MVRKVYLLAMPVKMPPLIQNRWHIRVLALLHDLNGARFVVLKSQLGVSAESLSKSLAELTGWGLVMRNPGHGHPLRPEYVLTQEAQIIARLCSRYVERLEAMALSQVMSNRWSVPLLVEVAEGCHQFNALRRRLVISPRALTQGLGRLCGVQLIVKRDGYWPTSDGVALAEVAAPMLARHFNA